MTTADPDSVALDGLDPGRIQSDAHFLEWQEMSLDDACTRLRSSPEGLADSEISARRSFYGPNEIAVDPPGRMRSILWSFRNPMALMLELAVLTALLFGQLVDAIIILVMLIANAFICYYGDHTSSNVTARLKDQLALKCDVKRSGTWHEVGVSEITIGDVISIQDGDVIPADCKLLTNGTLLCDEASLTGNEKSVHKTHGDVCFNGASVKTGTGEAIVFAIGNDTFFGNAVDLLKQRHRGRLQIILTKIGHFAICFVLVMIILELSVQVGYRNAPLNSAFANALVLIVGAVPIAMPTVLSVIMALGAVALAKKGIVVRRLNAVEELASMDVLCANKSGMVSSGKVVIDQSETLAVNGHTAEEVLFYAAVAAPSEPSDPIDKVILDTCPQKDSLWVELERQHFIPFDAIQKRTIASVRVRANGNTFRVAKGAPWVMLLMDRYTDLVKAEIENKISDLAGRGFGVVGVAVSRDPSDMPIDKVHWELIGILAVKDPPREDYAVSLHDAKEVGVDVKMITGEQLASAVMTCKALDVPSNLQTGATVESDTDGAAIEAADGFAELYPQHKFAIIQRLQERGHIVGISGLSVSDCAALQKSNIGIAVPGSVVSARSASDVVLLVPGLAIVVEAISLSRIIFRRMHAYAVYSLVATVQVVMTFGSLTLFYNWYFPAFCILIMVVLKDGSLMALSKDDAIPSKHPERWNLRSIFMQALAFGIWLSLGTLLLFVLARHTSLFSALHLESLTAFGGTYKVDGGDPVCNWDLWFTPRPGGLQQCPNVDRLTNPVTYENNVWLYYQSTRGDDDACHLALAQAVCSIQQTRLAKLRSLVYLVVSITGHAVIFAARTKDFMWRSRPSNSLIVAFALAQLISTLLGTLGFGRRFSARTYFAGVGPATAIFAWLWAILLILPLDFIKFSVSKFSEKKSDSETQAEAA